MEPMSINLENRFLSSSASLGLCKTTANDRIRVRLGKVWREGTDGAVSGTEQ